MDMLAARKVLVRTRMIDGIAGAVASCSERPEPERLEISPLPEECFVEDPRGVRLEEIIGVRVLD